MTQRMGARRPVFLALRRTGSISAGTSRSRSQPAAGHGRNLQGTPEQVRVEVRRVREQTKGFRHIVGLSDDLLANTPLANARALVDEARRE